MTERNEPSFESEEEWEEESTLLTDELDHAILMHRDAHFGGDFKIMLDYYLGGHIGADPEFEIDRIEYLAEVEKELGQNLAPAILTVPEMERIGKSRLAYRQLKALYESNDDRHTLIADLILSEEELPEEEIDAIVAQGSTLVPDLIRILRADDFYDPLFPGYGYAPYLAILCLTALKAESAIIPLFEALNHETVFEEDVLLEAFRTLGKPAKEFLLKVLRGRPLAQDNLHAAFSLSAFFDDPEVAVACFLQLQDPEVQRNALLVGYLLANIDALKQTPYRNEFIALSKESSLPPKMQRAMEQIAKEWL